MIDIEEENAEIAGVMSRLSDEESGHFSSQKVDKSNRQGYKMRSKYMIFLLALFTTTIGNAQVSEEAMIDKAIDDMYAVISGPAGERDWDLFNSYFTPDANLGTVITNAEGKTIFHTFTPANYIERNGPMFIKQGFYEEELNRVVHHYAGLVQVFSTYQFRFEPDGPAIQRGINSVQLVRMDDGYKIASLVWAPESIDNPIPGKYLPE